MNEAARVFEEAIEWLHHNYHACRFFTERDIVWTLQLHLSEQMQARTLSYRVFNDFPILPGTRRWFETQKGTITATSSHLLWEGKQPMIPRFLQSTRVPSLLAIVFLLLSACGSTNARPPHYGVYLKEGAKFIEMGRFRELPDSKITEGIPGSKDTQPVIIVWLDKLDLQWFALGRAYDEGDEIAYDATPQSDGVLELRPRKALVPGRYCFVQGDPLALFGQFPIWCFDVGDWGHSAPVGVGTEAPKGVVMTSTPPNESSLIAVVNDQAISTQDYHKRVKFDWFQAGQVTDPQGLSLKTLDSMVDDQLLREQAQQRGITVSDDEITETIEKSFGYLRVPPTPASTPKLDPAATPIPSPMPVSLEAYEKAKKDYISRLETATGMSEADFRKIVELDLLRQKLYDDVTKDLPTTAEQVHARHILVAIRTPEPPAAPTPEGGPTLDPNAPTPEPTLEPRDEAQALARIIEVQQKLGAGEDFAAVALAYSDDPGSKIQGGDLGWFARDQGLVKEFENAAFSLETGQISDPVKTQFGYHLIQVEEREQTRVLDAYSLQQMKYGTYDRWLTDLRNTAKVQRLWSLDKLPPTPQPSSGSEILIVAQIVGGGCSQGWCLRLGSS